MDGAETIVHRAGSSKGDEYKARNLVRAASRVGAAHLLYISVVGADRIPIVSPPVRLPGRAARAFRAGANLAPEQAVGQRTREDFLAERVGS